MLESLGYLLDAGQTLTSAVNTGSMIEASTRVITEGDGTWFNNPVLTEFYWVKMFETIIMTLLSTLIAVLVGTPIGLILVATGPSGLWAGHDLAKAVNAVLGFIINVGRSLPFVILMIAIIPFTKLVVGSILGWQASVVPLAVAAIPFFARLVESNIQGVSAGKIEAAKMAGATSSQVMWGIQVREAMPALIQSTTVLTITLIGYSAMAGPLGGGGIGELAYNYGYSRFQGDVMLMTVIGVLVLVMVIQWIGDMLSRLVDHR